MDVLVLVVDKPGSPLYKTFTKSSYFYYLYKLVRQELTHPTLENSDRFGDLKTIIDNTENISTIIQQFSNKEKMVACLNKVTVVENYLKEQDLEVLKRDGIYVASVFKELLHSIDIHDINQYSIILPFLQEIASLLKSQKDMNEVILMKLQFLTYSLFSKDQGKRPIDSLIAYLNFHIFKDCPSDYVFIIISLKSHSHSLESH